MATGRTPSALAALTGLLLALLTMIGASPARANQAYAPDPCRAEPAGRYCARLTLDLRADYRTRSSRSEIFVDTGRDEDGPLVDVSLGRLPPNRPLGRALAEARIFVNVGVPSPAGPVQLTLGARAQLETPPRRPDDPVSSFRRTGRRLLLERATVEVGALTAGFGPSTFYFTPSLSYTTAYASEQNVTQIAYRFALPDNASLALALEDGRRRRVEDPAWGRSRGGLSIDPVVALRKTTPWGAMQIAGALHPVRAQATPECCRRVTGDSMGWAVSGGLEGYFETGLGSSELLVNLGTSAGALDYLNATNYPADYALSATGRVHLTRARALVVSAGNYFNRHLHAILSFSRVETELDAERFRLRTAGNIVQAALEYSPRRGSLLGVELSWSRDESAAAGAPRVANSLFTAVAYFRIRLSRSFAMRGD